MIAKVPPSLLQRAREVREGELSAMASPCVSVCRMEPGRGLCEGCLRTIDEIAEWGAMDDATRRRVWEQILERASSQEP